VPTRTADEYSGLVATAIHGVSPDVAFVVGNLVRTDGVPEGLILGTETRGRTWRRMATEVHDLARVNFQTVFFGDRLRGWVGGVRVDAVGNTKAVVFRTQDGGNHWREAALLGDEGLLVSAVHSLRFTSDSEGTITVMVIADTGERSETTYITQDAGRSWSVNQYRASVALRATDESTSMVDESHGFRVRPGDLPGVTVLHGTASGGRDWMPICDLTVRNLDTYFGQGR
jgi:photosystem II stability/assembly factor-like uncharacterized protein